LLAATIYHENRDRNQKLRNIGSTGGWWFSSSIQASAITKAGRHDIAEILLKVALKHQKKSNQTQT